MWTCISGLPLPWNISSPCCIAVRHKFPRVTLCSVSLCLSVCLVGYQSARCLLPPPTPFSVPVSPRVRPAVRLRFPLFCIAVSLSLCICLTLNPKPSNCLPLALLPSLVVGKDPGLGSVVFREALRQPISCSFKLGPGGFEPEPL